MTNTIMPPHHHQQAVAFESAALRWLCGKTWIPYNALVILALLMEIGFMLYYRVSGVYADPLGKVDNIIKHYKEYEVLSCNERGKQPCATTPTNDDGIKVAIITGGNKGIGLETAWALSKAGFKIILACRDEARAKEAIKEIHNRVPGSQVKFIKLDLASFKSVREFAEVVKSHISRLDLLINNAGVFMLPQYLETVDGFEMQYQVNYLANFLLIRSLLPIMKLTPSSRVISLSSVASYLCDTGNCSYSESGSDTYGSFQNYKNAKLALIMMSYSLQNKLSDQGIQFFTVHPGLVSTELHQNLPFKELTLKVNQILLKTPLEGALTTIKLALASSGSLNGTEILYYAEELPAEPSNLVKDESEREKLWIRTCKLLNLPEYI